MLAQKKELSGEKQTGGQGNLNDNNGHAAIANFWGEEETRMIENVV